MEEIAHNSVTTQEEHFDFSSHHCFHTYKVAGGAKAEVKRGSHPKDLVQEERMSEL